jgi:hypothetical protein
MATMLIRYIDTDVVGGAGDGSSWANAFATLTAWEAASSDLVTDNTWMHTYYRGDTQDTTAFTITGWTTGASNYILVEASADSTGRHRGIWDDGKVTFAVTNATGITIQEDYVRLKGFQVKLTKNDTSLCWAITVSSVGASDIRLENLIIRGVISNNTGPNAGVFINADTATVNIINCIIYGFKYGTNTSSIGIYGWSTTIVNVYSTIVCGCYVGEYSYDATVRINNYNSVIFNNTDDFGINFGRIDSDYCASDDANSTTYTNGVDFTGEAADWGNIFTDYANFNFTLKNYTGARCIINKGTSKTYGNPDMIDIQRGAIWDIGPFEYSSYVPRKTFVNFANGAVL